MINKPSSKQFNRMRLILSTYQDGTGMLKNKRNPMKVKTLPGWRDFKRAVAIAFDGEAPENKSIYGSFSTRGIARIYKRSHTKESSSLFS